MRFSIIVIAVLFSFIGCKSELYLDEADKHLLDRIKEFTEEGNENLKVAKELPNDSESELSYDMRLQQADAHLKLAKESLERAGKMQKLANEIIAKKQKIYRAGSLFSKNVVPDKLQPCYKSLNSFESEISSYSSYIPNSIKSTGCEGIK